MIPKAKIVSFDRGIVVLDDGRAYMATYHLEGDFSNWERLPDIPLDRYEEIKEDGKNE